MYLSIAARLSNKCVFIWLGHFYASSLISEGVDVATVSSALGHSAIFTTVNTPKGHTPPTEAIFDIELKVQRQI